MSTFKQNSPGSAVKQPNHLINEKSPYLLQHSYNPVNWYPWGQEAFDRAQRENKPIFLSIGYSTCHWCHVMEHESFEDPQVAEVLNDVFICIKVDREERPDIDNFYMNVCQAMTGSGGWPLTIIMTSEKSPFFAATYISKESANGRLGLLELSSQIQHIWKTRYDEIMRSAEQITAAFREIADKKYGDALGEHTLTYAYVHYLERFDNQHGGFGTAPKFPAAHNLLFLLRYWNRTGEKKALKMVEKTLQGMRSGGIYDQIGYGFHRYSTDQQWLVPHFEKMLYDQALLVMAYTEAFQATGKKLYEKTAQETISYVLRDMTSSSGGGFYSAEDADSEGIEGKFYLWSEEEIRGILDEDEADFAIKFFNVRPEGNFREQGSDALSGSNILHLRKSVEGLNVTEQGLLKRLQSVREKLFAARKKRIHPLKDDKILTDWNGLMIAALSIAGRAFGEASYMEAAKRAGEFILKTMRSPEGRLLHRYRDGEAAVPAFLDDYVFLIWGFLELYEATFETVYLRHALDLNSAAIDYFWDRETAGFFFTSRDGEKLFMRRKETYDGAIPSGNSVALLNLLRLGRITGNQEFEKKANAMAKIFSHAVHETPAAYPQLLCGIDFAVGLSCEVVIAGDSEAADTKNMINAVNRHFLPNKIVLLNPIEQASPDIHSLNPFTKQQASIGGKATAYVCQNYACQEPTTDVNRMLELLKIRKP